MSENNEIKKPDNELEKERAIEDAVNMADYQLEIALTFFEDMINYIYERPHEEFILQAKFWHTKLTCRLRGINFLMRDAKDSLEEALKNMGII